MYLALYIKDEMQKTNSIKWRIAQWLEIRWWKNYLSNKDVNSYLKQKRSYWRTLIASLDIKFDDTSRILDAGCGPAGIFMAFPEHEVVAIDPLLDKYEELSHFDQKKYPNISFHNSPLETFQNKDSFDWICCMNAINHVENWDKGLNKLNLLATSNGKLLLGVDVHNHSWLKWIFRKLPGDVLHPHQHDRTDYLHALTCRGWTIRKEYTWKKGLVFDYWLVVAELV